MDSDMERLRMYAQALRSNIHHLLSTLTPIDGLKGLETVKIPDKVRDCEQGDGSAHILDLEEAANAEELCKAREERAEMKVWWCVCVSGEGGEGRDEGMECVCVCGERERAEVCTNS